MLTFKNLKNLVDLPAHKEARVPTVKALEESGVSVVAKKILENHGSIHNQKMSRPITENTLNWAAQKFF